MNVRTFTNTGIASFGMRQLEGRSFSNSMRGFFQFGMAMTQRLVALRQLQEWDFPYHSRSFR